MPTSAELHERRMAAVPRGVGHATSIYAKRAKNAEIWSEDGQRFIDFGAGIAVAFVATIYGVGAANMFFLPAAAKIKSILHRQMQHKLMWMEGLIAIAEGENPRNIESKLRSYVH